MFRNLLPPTLALPTLLLLTACGEPTKREIASDPELRARLDQFEEETETLALSFSYEAGPMALAAPLDTPPVPANTLTLSTRELGSIFGNSPLTDNEYLSLNTASGIGRLLQSSYASEPAEEGWLVRIENVLDTRYLVIYWARSYDPPRIVNDEHYEGGTATVDVSLYDRDKQAYLLRFEVEGQATDGVEAIAQEWKMDEHLVYEINSLLRRQILARMKEKLEAQTGGSFPYTSSSPAEDEDKAAASTDNPGQAELEP